LSTELHRNVEALLYALPVPSRAFLQFGLFRRFVILPAIANDLLDLVELAAALTDVVEQLVADAFGIAHRVAI
jgi:hypothetical protein